jgi:phospholipase/lecithinase/hemolysin
MSTPTSLVFFGDSLTDDGNLYEMSDGVLSDELRDSISGEGGRVTNGPVWAEYMAASLGVTDYYNYAVADAEAIGVRTLGDVVTEHGYEDDLLVPIDDASLDVDINLGGQVDRFTEDFADEDLSDMTAVIMIGGNDFLELNPDVTEPQVGDILNLLNGILDATLQAAVDLADAGVGSVVICSLPTSEFFPFIAGESPIIQSFFDSFVDYYNAALNQAVALLGPAYDVTVLDMNAITETIAEDPEGFGFTEPYTETLRDPLADPTVDPDDVAFWDYIHPTTNTHAIMGAYTAAVMEGAQVTTIDWGDSRLTFHGGAETLVFGNDGRDTLFLDGGDDTVFGGSDNDFLTGAGGNDMMNGGSDNDRLFGMYGNDVMTGGGGDDTLRGGDGDDVMIAAGGQSVMLAGEGTDTFVFVEGDSGTATMNGGDGTDTLYLVLSTDTAADYNADAAGTLATLGLTVTDVENVVVLNDVDDLAGEAWFEDASAWGLI